MSLFDANLTKTRGDSQHSELFLALLPRFTVYTARVNQTFTTHDMIAQVTYDGGAGTLAEVLSGMTMLVGSAAGLSDVGVCRIRKDPTATIFYIGEGSSIDWADDLYITVVINFGLFPKHITIDSGGKTFSMDNDIAYSDQNTDFDPVPVLGSHAVLWLTGASVTVDFDASDSWVFDSTISAFSWGTLADSGISIANGATDNPTFTITAAGTYPVYCDETADNGKVSRGYRFIFVYDANNMPLAYDTSGFELTKLPSGNVGRGGWEYGVRLYNTTAIASVYDRALCILFSRDFYQNTEGSLGLLSERENIIATGWIYGNSIVDDPEQSSVNFSVFSGYKFLQEMEAFPAGLDITVSTPDTWVKMKNLTVDRGLFHFLHWRTTLTAVADVTLTGDSKFIATTESSGDSIWGQLIVQATPTILARPIFDRYSRLFIEIPWNLTPLGDRSGLDVMTITTADRAKTLPLNKEQPKTSQVIQSGVSVTRTGVGGSLYSLSYGHIPDVQGNKDPKDMFLLEDQSQANSLAGLRMGNSNNEFPNIPIEFTGNNRAFGIAPLQYGAIVLDDYSGNIIPVGIAYKRNPSTGAIIPTVSFEAETFEQLSVDGDIPAGGVGVANIPIPPVPPLPPFPPLPPLPPPPLGGGDITTVATFIPGKGFWFTESFDTASPVWWDWNIGLDPAKVVLNEYVNIDVSRVSGRAFTHTYDEDPELLTSPYPGAGWVPVIQTTDWDDYARDHLGSRSSILGRALAVNRGAADEFAFIANESFGSFQFGAMSFTGNSSGVVFGEKEIPYFARGGGHGAYGAGGWMFTWTTYNISTLTFDLDMTGHALVNSIANGVAINAKQTSGGLSGEAAMVWAGNYNILTTADRFTAFVDTGLTSNIGVYLTFGVDPTGQYIAGFSSAATLVTSSDGGLNFATPAGWVGVGRSIENCGDQNRWICETADKVYYTDDFFTTWTDKTGDLLEKADVVTLDPFMFRFIR